MVHTIPIKLLHTHTHTHTHTQTQTHTRTQTQTHTRTQTQTHTEVCFKIQLSTISFASTFCNRSPSVVHSFSVCPSRQTT